MAEPIDAYSDSFFISMGPYGVNLSFQVSNPHPDPSAPTPPTRIATIRMSVEHAKTMVLMMKRHIQRAEQEAGVQAQVSNRVLGSLGIAPEDWDTFWKSKP